MTTVQPVIRKKITNYNELVQEQARLELLLKVKKARIKQDVQELAAVAEPAINLVNVLSRMLVPEPGNSLMKTGGGAALEMILRQLMSGANPLLKFVVPTLARNYTSHYADKVVGFFQKVKERFSRKKKPAIVE